MRRTVVRALALSVAVVASIAVVDGPAGAVPPAKAAGSSEVGARHVVTLITGDRVILIERAGGDRQVTVERGPGREGVQFVHRTGKDAAGRNQLRVVPVDALPLLAAGRLDPRLFDISALVRMGYDDRSRPEVPLIVSYQPRVAATAAAPAGATTHRVLPSINGAALHERKDQAHEFWASITGPGGPAGTGGPAGMGGTGAGAGTARIWLDGQARLLDEASNAQIGVPAAWQAGFTGKGATVAVLDSGYDAAHPDLSTVVTEARDFTGSGSTADRVGHGTHVASIIAGSGAGSSGTTYRGVAPDATLIVGRVCVTDFCDESAILAGMEWAAERDATVVNMSLGSEATDGTDPLSLAVNNLTASSGSLFVVAAGNSGAPRTVGSPGAADAALTVASVGRTDALSAFSSQGPRIGDFAIKPDIAAPGEGIVAARAAGTSMGTPVNDLYTAASGTSMATPHVAGAAAILAQQHPDWTAAQLKAALMSTAKAVDAGVYGQGAGRVDIARAVSQPVTAQPASVSFGLQRWPFADDPPVSRTVTYRNDGAAAVGLNLAITATDPTGGAAAPDAFTLNADTVTVPARGTADVVLTVHPGALGTTNVGAFAGRVVATGPAGEVVQTVFGVTTETESYDVRVRLIDRAGKPVDGALPADVSFILLDRTGGGTDPTTPPITNGAVTVRMPKGAYGVSSLIVTDDPKRPGRANASASIEAVPRLVVDRAGIALTFDARRTRHVRTVLDAPNPARVRTDVTTQFMVKVDGGEISNSTTVIGGPGNDFFTSPVRGDPRVFSFGLQTILTATGYGPDRIYFLAIPVLGRIPDPRFRIRDHDLHRTDAVYRAQGVDAAIGDRVEFPFFMPGQSSATNDIVPTAMPSRRLEFHSAGMRWSGPMLQQFLPGGIKFFFEGSIDVPDAVYRAGRSVRQEWNRAAFSADLAPPNFFNQVFRTGNTLRAIVASDAPSEPGHTGNPVGNLFYVRGTAVLTRDGTVLATRAQPSINSFTLPADTGRYTLTLDANRARPWSTLSTRVTTAWTFTSGPPAVETERLPLPTVKVGGAFDGANRARSGVPFTLRLAASTQVGAAPSAITTVSLEMSGDDGATWQAVRVTRDRAGIWCAHLTNPAGPGFVSLRVKAANAAGNTVEHTIIRAYGLTQ